MKRVKSWAVVDASGELVIYSADPVNVPCIGLENNWPQTWVESGERVVPVVIVYKEGK